MIQARIKEGANISGLRSEMALAYFIACTAYHHHGCECVLTEGTGGKHGRASLHYVGLAIDLRTKNIGTQREIQTIEQEIRNRLGTQFDVVLESDHIHIEFQPK